MGTRRDRASALSWAELKLGPYGMTGGSLAGATADALDGDQAGLFVHGVEDAVEGRAEAVVAGRGATAGAGGPGLRLQGVERLVDGLQGLGIEHSEVF